MRDGKQKIEIERPNRVPLAEPEVNYNSNEVQASMASDDSVSRANRPKRIPVGSGDRLKFSNRPGYYRRIVNDDPNNPGRIQAHLDAGYSFVTGKETGGPETAADPSKMSSRVSKHVGGGVIGYLMEQPMKWREEDLALKNRRVDESEEDMQRAMVSAPGRYGKASINQKSEEVKPNR